MRPSNSQFCQILDLIEIIVSTTAIADNLGIQNGNAKIQANPWDIYIQQ